MRIACLALALAGCLESKLVECGDLLCPVGTTCVDGACRSHLDVRVHAGDLVIRRRTDTFDLGPIEIASGEVEATLLIRPREHARTRVRFRAWRSSTSRT